jgi:hypothetical protein
MQSLTTYIHTIRTITYLGVVGAREYLALGRIGTMSKKVRDAIMSKRLTFSDTDVRALNSALLNSGKIEPHPEDGVMTGKDSDGEAFAKLYNRLNGAD